MRIEQCRWSEAAGWTPAPPGGLAAANLVLVFAGTAVIKAASGLEELRKAYPAAQLVGCSTAGEICDVNVTDDTLVATAVHFERTRVLTTSTSIQASGSSRAAGRDLARALNADGLVHVFVLSDGLSVNGSDLVEGLRAELPPAVTVTGGLSGDGTRFEETFVLGRSGQPERDAAIAVGFYGDHLAVGYGSLGGWDAFGPERVITRASGNVLYELDGKSALELYRTYLGEHGAGLPATGLLFPLCVRVGDSEGVVRTILAVSDADDSMTFAGDLPVGAYARLMKANVDRLVDGAAGAARATRVGLSDSDPELAILISCVGRKMVLKQRIEEEVEAVREVLGATAALTGFYSYGEISPFTSRAKCELHNQTMTITTLSEV